MYKNADSIVYIFNTSMKNSLKEIGPHIEKVNEVVKPKFNIILGNNTAGDSRSIA